MVFEIHMVISIFPHWEYILLLEMQKEGEKRKKYLKSLSLKKLRRHGIIQAITMWPNSFVKD